MTFVFTMMNFRSGERMNEYFGGVASDHLERLQVNISLN